ncbi:hypothetical protein P175DRAFT_0498580 [Aspergillus ochraceoroseus IBT 24754]|nr:uncharacterized protein P175DRAFT_0498580 [Aspergillus ochraceoroseus IBT 24754]PTU25472.1 hypothetical protein P175DRAFT_0498580 [Aspergillus ochraceoroseus IBT 24754]
MRGFEPLAPKHWQFDFPTLPDSLFSTSENKSAPIIKTSRSTTFYAIKSLACLFSLSGRVRDCSILEKRPEALIKQTIEQYIRWALYDADLSIDRGSIPVHVIYAQKKNEPTLNALTRLNNRLQKLALRHHLALKETPNIGAPLSDRLPLLIGFVICGPIVAIMTFDPDPQQLDESTDGRFMSQFDLSERGQDVWNSLAIAIAVIHVRNTMIRLSQDGIGGFRRTRRSSPTDNDF